MRFSRTSFFPRPSVGRRLIPATLLVAGLVVAACASGSNTAPTSSPTTLDVSTLPPGTDVGVPDSAAPDTVGTAPTTTPSGAPAYPLTGLPMADPTAADRPAVVVKVGNYDAHPQRGSNNADIIYEEIINANVSRFAFVFQSKSAREVGPIRSGRRQDIDLFGSFNKPVFAWAGGNPTVTGEIRASDLVDFSQSKCKGTCYRSGDDSPVEFTLMFNVDQVFKMAFPTAGKPPAQFQYLASGEAPAGAPSSGVKLTMENYKIDWTWNAATKQYDRVQNGRPDKDKNGPQISMHNVVVLEMVYIPGVSHSPDAQSTGKGQAWVFTGGNVVHGNWARANRSKVFTLTDDAGKIIKLTPGRTFIELPRKGNTTPK